MAYSTEELGRLIARAHYQAWRTDAPPFDLTVEELAAILPNLIKSGSAGIVWHRVKPFREKYGAMAYALEAATDAQIAHNVRVEEAVVEVVTRLRAYGIEPVLVKGLAMAKLYPDGIVRPAGDIDLVVRKEEFAAAHALIHDSTKLRIPIGVDLKHPDIWGENPDNNFWERLASQQLGELSVSTLGPVDNLRMLCFHYWKDRGQRVLWVSDVAMYSESLDAIELADSISMTDSFDRDRVLTLTHINSVFLGAHYEQEVMQYWRIKIPDWLCQALLSQWADPKGYAGNALSQMLKEPHLFLRIVAERWPQPIDATVDLRSPFDSSLRGPLQVGCFSKRFLGWPIHNLPQQWRTYRR